MKKIKLLLASLGILIIPTMALTQNVSAVDVSNEVCQGQGSDSAFCEDSKSNKNPIYGPDGFITSITNIVTIIVGIVAVVAIIIAGLKFITSGSDPQDVSSAREAVIYALIALVVAGLAQVIVRFFINKLPG
jgi:hypothetical protein